MKLNSITIENYRCIKALDLPVADLADGSHAYGLIGVNEAGKSSLLMALALRDPSSPKVAQKDFFDDSTEIFIKYNYALGDKSLVSVKEILDQSLPDVRFSQKDYNNLTIIIKIQRDTPEVTTYSLAAGELLMQHLTDEIMQQLISAVKPFMHKAVFWKAEDRYLISQPINLASFSADPMATSVPLRNCFNLAGIEDVDIAGWLTDLDSNTPKLQELQEKLSKKVTEHIKSVWSNHPVNITFIITNGHIHFHVNDNDSSARAKTADQRSEGFRQFISFLLTISAESKKGRLSNTILLLDEPETHLHPQAQEFLLKELILISKSNQNVVLLATHSNYMIDKLDLSRNYRVRKMADQTSLLRLSGKTSSYASVNFEVYGVLSSDYHNELYGKLHAKYQDADISDKDRAYINNFDNNFLSKQPRIKQSKVDSRGNNVTLSTYIRHCIHHPDNGQKYTPDELSKSTNLLRSQLGITSN